MLKQTEMEFPNEESKSKKREFRQTSHDAHESIKESKYVHYAKITVGLVKLGVGGVYTEIAFACGLKPDQVNRRLSEMVRDGLVYNTGETRVTPSGRKALVRQLVILKK